jgi:formylmethanofuran dehydrogenase subunit E
VQRRDVEMDDDARGPDGETFECSMCHQEALVRRSIMMGGRRLCLDCASGWFEDEDPDDPPVNR